MSEQLKFIVEALNKAPFNRNYNLISFDSLQPLQLLQVLNDVFTEISPQEASDLRVEDPEQRVIRMFAFLKRMKYKPPKSEAGALSEFRQGLVQGDKPVVYPILQWLLERSQELKKRAYLVNYLFKLDVPPDILLENEVQETYNTYLELLEQFKNVHQQSEQIKDSGMSVSEIKKDILSMEEEQEQLRKRIERQQKRVDTLPSKGKVLNAAKQYRLERDREASIAEQRQTQKQQLAHAEQRISRMQVQLKDLQAAGVGVTGEGLIKQLEEENQVNAYLTQEKIPKELEAKKSYCAILQKVADEPAMGQAELDQLNKQIKSLSAEINQLVEKRMMKSDPMDDKLSVFRQQAGVIANKKSAIAETLQEVMEELNAVEAEAKEKKSKLNDADGAEVLKGEEFKRYVNKLRGKSTTYKKKRQEMSELQAEVGVLSRTFEVLKSKEQHTQTLLAQLEAKHGISGFHSTQEELEKVSTMKSDIDQQKGKTLEDMSQMVVQLTNAIAEKKNAIAPIIRELRPMRQQCQELAVDYEQKKGIYETTAAGLESNMSKLEQEVKGLREESNVEESRFYYIEAMIKILEVQKKRVEDEMKLYVSSDTTERKKSLRDQYTQRIHEQENLGKALREKQKFIREAHGPNMKQMKMWSDLTKILQCKKELQTKSNPATSLPEAAYESEDHLVL